MRTPHGAVALVVLASSLGSASSAAAVSRTCGPDPAANTANVLCAPPSGPCTPTSVTMSANIEVTSGSCSFNLGGRSLVVQKTFQMAGDFGAIEMLNAGDVTVTSTGKLKARGDFVQPNGFIVPGGSIRLEAAGSITHAGVLDVSGDPAGVVQLEANAGVAFQKGSLLRADGTTSFTDLGQRFADGGEVEIFAFGGGGVALNGDVSLVGTNAGAGGALFVTSARDVTVGRQIDASGGASDGGLILLTSGDSVTVRAPLDVHSRNGGGYGGFVEIEAGDDDIGGVVGGGNVLVDGAPLIANGSAADTFGGDGGEVTIAAAGSVSLTGPGAAIRVNAGTQFDGSGGGVTIVTGAAYPSASGPFDVVLDAPIHASGGNTGGFGGLVYLEADGDLEIGESLSLTGRQGGGDLVTVSGAATAVRGALAVHATSATGVPGYVEMIAGRDDLAPLTVAANVLAFGGSKSKVTAGGVTLSSCALVVEPNVKIDGHAGVVDGVGGGGRIELISRVPMLLGAGSQFLAYPAGQIRTVHPPGQDPVVGNGVVFNPSRLDVPTAAAPYPACGGL